MINGFARLSDVEVVAEPTESANVLIEENGVIKKAPKGEVGGEKADLVIRADDFPFLFRPSAETPTFTIENGSLEFVSDALAAGEAPVVKVKLFSNSNDSNPIVKEGGVFYCITSRYNSSFSFTFNVGDMKFRIVMDNTDPAYLEFWTQELSTFSEIQVI